MAYETGTASSPHDLLDKLRVFIAANGWTIEQWLQINGGNPDIGYRLVVSKGGNYWGLRSGVDKDPRFESNSTFSSISAIFVTGFDGHNSGAELDAQTNYAGNFVFAKTLAAGVDNYWFFTNENNSAVFVVLEYQTDTYSFLSFGVTENVERQFFTATSNALDKNDDGDSRPAFWAEASDETNYIKKTNGSWGANLSQSISNSVGGIFIASRGHPNYGQDTDGKGWHSRSSAGYSGITAFQHIYQFERDAAAGNAYRYCGTVDGAYYVNLKLLQPKQELSIGSDTYIVFPFYQKPSPFSVAEVHSRGVAIKKVV